MTFVWSLLCRWLASVVISMAIMLGSCVIVVPFGLLGWGLGTLLIGLMLPAQPSAAALQLQIYAAIFMAGMFAGGGSIILPLVILGIPGQRRV